MANLMQSYKVAATHEFTKPIQMLQKQVPGTDYKILVSRVRENYFATSANCTHYGAPLANGVLDPNGNVRCPWHGACFRVATGDIEDGPALDALQSYPVEVQNGEIYIKANESKLQQSKRDPCKTVQISGKDHVVVVGGGAGGLSAVQTLRSCGFAGSVTMISSEGYLPIDRTKLSKTLLTDFNKLAWRDQAFFDKHNIKVVFDKVSSVSPKDKKITLESGKDVLYTKLILSTGGSPRSLPLPGFDSSNVFLLRTQPHAKAIVDATSSGNPRIVIVGSSFIGMELALCLKDKDVTVVGIESAPLSTVLGEQVGKAIQSIHESNGVKFKLSAEVKGAKTENGKVTHVELKDGSQIPADVVILGVGVAPQTSYLQNFNLEKDKSIAVDSYLRVKGQDDIFACGDIATFPLEYGASNADGRPVRIEHWDVAMNHGLIAARNAMGENIKHDKVPVFWSAQGGQLRYTGHPTSGNADVVIKGDLKERKFVAYYTEGDSITAVASMGMDPVVAKCIELFAAGKVPSRKEVESGVDILQIELPPKF